MVVVLFIAACLILAWFVAKVTKSKNTGVQSSRHTSKDVKLQNATARLFYEFFLEFAICMLINISYVDLTSYANSLGFSMSVICIALTLLVLTWLGMKLYRASKFKPVLYEMNEEAEKASELDTGRDNISR